MSRQIKFRGKSRISGDLVTGIYIDGFIINGVVEANSEYIVIENWEPVHPETVGQYIGSCDRNGVEIFENDIYRRDYEIGREIFDPVTLGFEDYEITKSGYYIGKVAYRPSMGFILNSVAHFDSEGEYIEKRNGIKIHPDMGVVIGNIHQNLKLLEGEENA